MPQSESTAAVPISKAFMIYSGQLPPVVLVAIEGRQRWQRDILPALKRAASELAGHRVSWDDLYVTGIEGGDADDYPIEFFKKSHADERYVRVFVHPDQSYTIFRPVGA